MNYTQAQTDAIYSDQRELLVSAAAGSGKTAVLVERIVRMISRNHMSIDRMLIVTFTRAAAAEMRERLETRLYEEAERIPSLQRQADMVGAAQISTLHSYCVNVVRENFQHCDIDPQFTMSDERTRTQLYDESLNEVLEELYALSKHDDHCRSLCEKYSEREIAVMIDSMYPLLMSRPDPLNWLWDNANRVWDAQSICNSEISKAFLDEAAVSLAGMRSLLESAEVISLQPSFPPAYLKTIRDDDLTISTLEAAVQKGFRELIAALGQMKFTTLGRAKPVTTDEIALADKFKAIREQYKGLAAGLKKLVPVDFDTAAADLASTRDATIGLAKALEMLHTEFTARKKEQSVLDFSDLEHMTLNILSVPDLKKRESERFDAIFVDEYQDISALQEAILQALKRENGQYFFYVGDVKQSIYRFRLAEPRLFLSKLDSFDISKDAVQRKIMLNLNFRSRSNILSSVNRVFKHVMHRSVMEIDYDADAALYAGSESFGDPETELHIINSENTKPVDLVLAQAVLIAEDILKTVGQPVLDGAGQPGGILKFRDIAILMPVCRNVADKVELTLQRMGIPVYSDTAIDSYQSDEIVQLVAHLSLLDNLMNDVALLSELRGPLFEVSEPELAQIRLMKPEKEASFLSALLAVAEQADSAGNASLLSRRCAKILADLEHERFLFHSMNVEEYLWDFMTRSGLYAHYGVQPGGKLRQANLRSFCMKAGDYIKTHSDGLSGFLSTVSVSAGSEVSPTVLNPWEDVVRIMSVHKSKGLEFNTVYLMGLGDSINKRTRTKAFSIHSQLGFALGYVNEQARTKRTTLLQSAIALRENREERAERARVLYVAMTRPKNRLVMLGCMNFDPEHVEEGPVTQSVENASQELYEVCSAKSMLDWLLQSAQPGDFVERVDEMFSTNLIRKKTSPEEVIHRFSTGFPQKKGFWRLFFHIRPLHTSYSKHPSPQKDLLANEQLSESSISEPNVLPSDESDMSDPIAPKLTGAQEPLKLGVTALCRMTDVDSISIYSQEDEVGEAAAKRIPLTSVQPYRLDSLPNLPAFLNAASGSEALERGIQTHKLLGLVSFDALRQATGTPVVAILRKELRSLTDKGVFQKDEAAFADCGMAARFFNDSLGVRALQSQLVQREWSFNLRVHEPIDTILQGVIDLCFLEDGQWVLVDYKTDRVDSSDELWQKYERQLWYYREALQRGTPYPVKECALFSLRLGNASVRLL